MVYLYSKDKIENLEVITEYLYDIEAEGKKIKCVN
jgi:hypothetical protein